MSTGSGARDSTGCIQNYDICARAWSSFCSPFRVVDWGGGGGGGVFKPPEHLRKGTTPT